MMRRLQAWALLILFLAVIGGGLHLWWRFDLRWRPHVIKRQQGEIARLLEGSGWVSPGPAGPKLYLLTFRDCPACDRYQVAEFPALQKAGVDTRVIAIARADLNGQSRSNTAERSTVAELWVNRSWGLYQRWTASPSASWNAAGLAHADDDAARSAVVETGRQMTERLAPLLKANGIRFGYPLLVWWTRDGRMEGCACQAPQSWPRVRQDLGIP
jgi:hypothetical protein